MGAFDKLIERLLSLDSNLRFEELKKILLSLGYEMRLPGKGGSHCTFRKPGRDSITVPKRNPIKLAYVKKVKEAYLKEDDEHVD